MDLLSPNSSLRTTPIDQDDRNRAITTFDRNVVVTAGAGTGKTTLLVNRLIHLIFRKPDPIKMTEIVALTFTKKAANEMKARLIAALADFQDPDSESEKVKALIDRYELSLDEIRKRSEGALRQLEHAEIGTIHHFATALLRLFPIEAGVDPQFRILKVEALWPEMTGRLDRIDFHLEKKQVRVVDYKFTIRLLESHASRADRRANSVQENKRQNAQESLRRRIPLRVFDREVPAARYPERRRPPGFFRWA